MSQRRSAHEKPTAAATPPSAAAPTTAATAPTTAATAPTRRAVLRASGAAGTAVLGAAALAACGTGGSGSGAKAGSSPTPVSGIPASEIPLRGGRVLSGTPIVVTQPAEGTFKAFSAICPHQGCEVSEVTKNVIVCPCHGSTFDAATGARLSGPAQTGLTPLTLTESGTTLDVQ